LIAEDKRFLNSYYGLLKKLKSESHELYAYGKPSINRIQQGPEGNCFFFSGVGWHNIVLKS